MPIYKFVGLLYSNELFSRFACGEFSCFSVHPTLLVHFLNNFLNTKFFYFLKKWWICVPRTPQRFNCASLKFCHGTEPFPQNTESPINTLVHAVFSSNNRCSALSPHWGFVSCFCESLLLSRSIFHEFCLNRPSWYMGNMVTSRRFWTPSPISPQPAWPNVRDDGSYSPATFVVTQVSHNWPSWTPYTEMKNILMIIN